MKKITALAMVILFILCNAVTAAAGGISFLSKGGDVVKICEDVDITDAVNGNVIAVLGDISINDDVNGQVVVVFGNITINAGVSGQVVSLFGETRIMKDASVTGDVITLGSLTKDSGAMIAGREVRIIGEAMNLDIGSVLYLRLALTIVFSLAVLIIGLLVLTISRDKYGKIARSIDKNTGRKLILGVLSFFSAGILFLMLLVTLVVPAVYIIVMVLSAVTASMFLGRIILKTFSSGSSMYTEFITGLISITLLKLLLLFLIPQKELFIGLLLTGVINAFIFSLGLGIHIEEYYSSRT